MKNYIPFVLLLISNFGFSQTKLIAHKSHSGSDATFASAVENNLFDISESNFGVIQKEDRIERNSNLDSVIYVSNDKIIMVTSKSATVTGKMSPKSIRSLGIWKNGRDTVANHNLFKRNHALDSIKNVLKKEYNFINDIDKVIFVGFDNKKEIKAKRKRKKSVIPIISNEPKLPNSFFLIVVLGFLSVLVYFVSTVFSRKLTVVS